MCNSRFRIKAISTMLASRRLCPTAKSVHLNTLGTIRFEGDYSIHWPRRSWRGTHGLRPAGESNGDWTQVVSFIHRGDIGGREGQVRSANAAGADSPGPQIPDASGSTAPPDVAVPRRDPQEGLRENQKNLRRDADQLLHLAQELKDEADKTEQTNVLSLSVVHKAEEVEKLAKHIKGLARAS